jgi:hypothetical protein
LAGFDQPEEHVPSLLKIIFSHATQELESSCDVSNEEHFPIIDGVHVRDAVRDTAVQRRPKNAAVKVGEWLRDKGV